MKIEMRLLKTVCIKEEKFSSGKSHIANQCSVSEQRI
jgi:hypothetical protein